MAKSPTLLTPFLVPIQTFAPDPYVLLRPLQVVVQAQGDEYVASFVDANLSASGATENEAVLNLKDLMVAALDRFSASPPARLGTALARQLAVLKTFLHRAD